MAGEQRTEQPTPQRLRKARREGRFPVSREAVFALEFLAATGLLTGLAASWFPALAAHTRFWLAAACTLPATPAAVVAGWRDRVLPLLAALFAAGCAVRACGLLGQLASTGFGFSGSRIKLDFARLNPASRLKSLPRENLWSLVQAVVWLPLFGAALWAVVAAESGRLLQLPSQPLAASLQWLGAVLSGLLWKAALLFAAFGAWDLLRVRRRYLADLRMTRQEVRQEWKENEGSPEIKQRLRRLRREMSRRRMMAEVPQATAVVVNPTHFAVALRYDMQAMAAPKVVAKGKNLVALRIRQLALEHQVPIVENPPLAQALYKTVAVGQEIPAQLYRAVAEILAYIYRITNRRAPGG